MSTKVTPKQAELLVYGYTRILSQYWGIRTPTSVQSLCLFMYSYMDRWNKDVDEGLKEGLKFDLDENILILADNNTGGWLNGFGTHIIGKGMKKVWQFRICEKPSSSSMLNAAIIIGIIDVKLLERKERFKGNFTNENGGYGFYSSDGGRYGKLSRYQGQSYGQKWSHGSIITMQLNMMGSSSVSDDAFGTIEYWVNGKHQGLAFYEIDLEKQYCLAVAMLYSNEAIQLIALPDIGDL